MKIILNEEQEKALTDFLNVESIIESGELEVYAPTLGRKIGRFFIRKGGERLSMGFSWARYFREEIRNKLKGVDK